MARLTRLAVLEQRCCAPPPLAPADAATYVQLFRALGDETRVQIVRLLAMQSDPLCVCTIEAAFDLSQPTISHHLKILRDADLVLTERQGVWIYYRLNHARFEPIRTFLQSILAPSVERKEETANV
jgi:ArsR family transcriptional regulator, arsenate/arsenite/antimonite-responsive transcriptional repressor